MRVQNIFDNKQIPSITFWFSVTFVAGAVVAYICLMLWSTMSPFEKVATPILLVQYIHTYIQRERKRNYSLVFSHVTYSHIHTFTFSFSFSL